MTTDIKEEHLIKKYLKKNELDDLNIIIKDKIEIISNDTMNEEVLKDKIIKTGLKEELFVATLQLSIAGYARNNYNQYKYKGVVKEIKDLFKKADVKYDNSIQAKLDIGILTPRRLQRIFRFQIKDFLEKNKQISSFIYNKYGNDKQEYRSICFPSAEHLIETKEEGKYLYEVYKRMDHDLEKRNLQHGFSVRCNRVLLARGIDIES